MKAAKDRNTVGIAWYRREDWQDALAVFTDRLLLPSSYDKWLDSAEYLEAKIRKRGAVPVKAYIDPATFPAWCRKHGLELNSRARQEYASETARRRQAEKS
jgi:hypothetical protein